MSHKKLYALTYAQKASFAHVLCTTSSGPGVIGTGLAAIFDSDHTSVVFSSNVSDDITYTADAGTFTFSRAGVYHIILVANTQQESSSNNHSFEMKLNSESALYVGQKRVNTGYDPVESTHQTIVSITAADVLHLRMKTAGNTATIIQGTSVIITEITSGHYASQLVTANGTTTDVAEYNPFDTNLSGNPSSYTTVTAGMTVTGTDGSFTANSAGRYLIMVSNYFVMAVQGGGPALITMKLKKGGTTFATRAVMAIIGDDVAENTFCLIEDLGAGDVLTITWTTNDTDAGQGVRANIGTNFSAYRLHEEVHTNGDTSGFFGYPYISVQSLADSISTVATVSPFDEDSYSSDDFETRSVSDITFTPADGKFTVSEPGLYAVVFNPIFSLSSGGTAVITINVNGVTQVTGTGKVAQGPDPLDKTTTAFLELNKNDYVEIFTDMEAGKPAVVMAGTSIAIYRYFGFFKTEDTVADGLIGNDFTLDTFSQGNLSAQYERSVDQVPFKMGIRGALNLRGRPIARPSVVKLGDKKN